MTKSNDSSDDSVPVAIKPSGSSAKFREMMKKSSDLETLTSGSRFNLGTRKKSKLQRVLGIRGADSTLLADDVAKAHAARLFNLFRQTFEHLEKAGTHQERLRFVTILHDTVPLDADIVIESVSHFELRLAHCLKRAIRAENMALIGAIEIEVVNMDYLKGAITFATRKSEKRKFNVLSSMIDRSKPKSKLFQDEEPPPPPTSFALVHIHALVDLGENPERSQKVLEAVFRREWNLPYQVEIKETFRGKKLIKSLSHIARYLTKGGNIDLRYSTGFGMDSTSPEKLEQQMFKAGKLKRKVLEADDPDQDEDASTVTDASSLTRSEIKTLGEIWHRLMGKKPSKKNGYLVRLPAPTWQSVRRSRSKGGLGR